MVTTHMSTATKYEWMRIIIGLWLLVVIGNWLLVIGYW
jgi:hypothetical protein